MTTEAQKPSYQGAHGFWKPILVFEEPGSIEARFGTRVGQDKSGREMCEHLVTVTWDEERPLIQVYAVSRSGAGFLQRLRESIPNDMLEVCLALQALLLRQPLAADDADHTSLNQTIFNGLAIQM